MDELTGLLGLKAKTNKKSNQPRSTDSILEEETLALEISSNPPNKKIKMSKGTSSTKTKAKSKTKPKAKAKPKAKTSGKKQTKNNENDDKEDKENEAPTEGSDHEKSVYDDKFSSDEENDDDKNSQEKENEYGLDSIEDDDASNADYPTYESETKLVKSFTSATNFCANTYLKSDSFKSSLKSNPSINSKSHKLNFIKLAFQTKDILTEPFDHNILNKARIPRHLKAIVVAKCNQHLVDDGQRACFSVGACLEKFKKAPVGQLCDELAEVLERKNKEKEGQLKQMKENQKLAAQKSSKNSKNSKSKKLDFQPIPQPEKPSKEEIQQQIRTLHQKIIPLNNLFAWMSAINEHSKKVEKEMVKAYNFKNGNNNATVITLDEIKYRNGVFREGVETMVYNGPLEKEGGREKMLMNEAEEASLFKKSTNALEVCLKDIREITVQLPRKVAF